MAFMDEMDKEMGEMAHTWTKWIWKKCNHAEEGYTKEDIYG